MPPRPKVTREEVLNAAYEIADEIGADAISAREVGGRLGVTTSPVFTYYSNMEELKREVYLLAKNNFIEYLLGCKDFKPAFKEFGMRWFRFSVSHPNLYCLILESGNLYGTERNSILKDFGAIVPPLVKEIEDSFGLNAKDSEELLRQMVLTIVGIVALHLHRGMSATEEEVSGLISEACLGTVFAMQVSEGNFDEKKAQVMLKAVGNMPKIINKKKGDN